MFSNHLDKYEYLAGGDIDLKPSTAEKARTQKGRTFEKIKKYWR